MRQRERRPVTRAEENFLIDLISDARECGSDLSKAQDLIDKWDDETGANWRLTAKTKGTSDLFN